MPTMTGAQVIVEYLKAEGVRYVFGVIGSAIMDIMDTLYSTPQIRFIATQHEQGAIFMADGWARATGEPGVCLVTVGPGATNLVSGVAQAYVESSPVVAISGDISTRVYGKGASNFHEIDQVSLFRPITKLSLRVERADHLAEAMERAFRTALTGRMGPVYLGIPRDIQRQTVEFHPRLPHQYRPIGQLRGDPALVQEATDLLVKAQNPLLLVGGGVRWAKAREAALKLAERLAMPAAITHSQRGLLPEDHPLVVGSLGGTMNPAAQDALSKTDLLLTVGSTMSELTTDRYGHHIIPRDVPIVQVDIDPQEIGRNFPVALGIVGDARAVLEEMAQLLEGKKGGGRLAHKTGHAKRIEELKEEWRERWRPAMESAAVPIKRLRLVKDVTDELEGDAIVCGSPGWRQMGIISRQPGFDPGDFSVLGSGLCLSMAAQLAFPQRQVVDFCGDGAMLMVLPELATAAVNNIPLIVVVPHNAVYGNVKWKQFQHFGGRYIGCDLPVPDLARMAELMGCYGERVEEPAQIKPALRRALASGRPAVLDVIVESAPEELEPAPRTLEESLHL